MKLLYFVCLYVTTIICVKACSEEGSEFFCHALNDMRQVIAKNNLSSITVTNRGNQLRHLRSADLVNAGNFLIVTIEGALDGIDDDALDHIRNARMLYLQRNNLIDLREGLFKNLSARTLSLRNNKIKNVQMGAFSDLPKLRTLNLEENRLNKIQTGVFNNLDVQEINLNNNNVFYIEDGAFFNMTYLTNLCLGGNKLNYFFPDSYFNYPSSVDWLELENNSLTYLGPETLHGLVSLKYLDIAGNLLTVVQKDTFKDTSNLEMLILSRNKLVELNADIFPEQGLLKLFFLFIDHNRLTYLPKELLSKLGGKMLKEMAVVGNPWQCACFDKIFRWMNENAVEERCNEEYANGKRPFCVVPRGGRRKKCYKTIPIDLYEIYHASIKSYGLPYCHV